MLEFHTTTDCPFCGVRFTRLWWKGKAITAIKHPHFQQDLDCRGTDAVDPSHGRHMLISNYERLAEHLSNEAYVRSQQRRQQFSADFGISKCDVGADVKG